MLIAKLYLHAELGMLSGTWRVWCMVVGNDSYFSHGYACMHTETHASNLEN